MSTAKPFVAVVDDDSASCHQETVTFRRTRIGYVQKWGRIYTHVRFNTKGGHTSYLEMLNAEISLFRTHLSYAQMQGTVYSSMVSLYEGMGVGSVGDAERVTARMRGANGAPVAPEVGTPAGGKGTVP